MENPPKSALFSYEFAQSERTSYRNGSGGMWLDFSSDMNQRQTYSDSRFSSWCNNVTTLIQCHDCHDVRVRRDSRDIAKCILFDLKRQPGTRVPGFVVVKPGTLPGFTTTI